MNINEKKFQELSDPFEQKKYEWLFTGEWFGFQAIVGFTKWQVSKQVTNSDCVIVFDERLLNPPTVMLSLVCLSSRVTETESPPRDQSGPECK